jgi:hypothetical protein
MLPRRVRSPNGEDKAAGREYLRHEGCSTPTGTTMV